MRRLVGAGSDKKIALFGSHNFSIAGTGGPAVSGLVLN